MGPFVRGLSPRQLKDRSQRFLSDIGCLGKPPRASLCHEMAHGDGSVAILAEIGRAHV